MAKKVAASPDSIHVISHHVSIATSALKNAHKALIRANKAVRAEQIHLANASSALARANEAIVANKKKKLTYAEISRRIGGKPGNGTYNAIRKLASAKKAQR